MLSIINIDLLLGNFAVISGRVGSGKSRYLYLMLAEKQKTAKVALIDVERTFNPERATELGVDVATLHVEEAHTMEELLACVEDLKHKVALICVNGIWTIPGFRMPVEEMSKGFGGMLQDTTCIMAVTIQTLKAPRQPFLEKLDAEAMKAEYLQYCAGNLELNKDA
jgi:hypothetical protein